MRRVLSILHLLLAVSALAQNTLPSSFEPMGRLRLGGFPAWDAVPRADAAYQASISTHSSSPTTTVSFAEAAVVVVSVTNSTVISVDFSGADYSKGFPVMQVWLDYPALGPVVTLASGNLEYVGDEPDLTVTTAGTRQYFSFMAVGAGRKVLCSKWHQTEGE